ncbi:MAG: EAL domain-containing protein [Candidatus Nanopelagicales bacterium]
MGIGSSAGGVEALRELLPALPAGDVAYVVAQHMSPQHPSLLLQVLGRETSLPVREIGDSTPLVAGEVFLAPPNRDVRLRGAVLTSAQAEPRISPQPSIDALLTSIAAEAGPAAIGVVLSGTGSDGVAGMRAVRAAGGRTFAQDPSSARYRDMPGACIDAGVVDVAADPVGIGAAIGAVLSGQRLPETVGRFSGDLDLAELAAETRRVTAWDIASYKDGTLGRQLAKRIAKLGLGTTAEYVTYVRETPAELETLRDSMLITVTGFLRDRKSFDALADALRPVVAAKSSGQPLRAWVAGCATGEEAYSVAMLLAETAREQEVDTPVKVFATDISDAAMETARRGTYPVSALAEVPEEWRRRYFTVTGDLAQVDKRLREMLVIARQDVTRDPPLVRMDLVSCRNLLIYLIPDVQDQVLANLHAALAPQGLLFLGRSESIPADTPLFATVDAASRVFQTKPGSTIATYTGLPRTPILTHPVRRPAGGRSSRDRVRDRLRDTLLGQYGPATVLVDPDGIPVHTVGDVRRFLAMPDADGDMTLAGMVVPELRTEVGSLLARVRRSDATPVGHTVVLRDAEGRAETWQLRAQALAEADEDDPYVALSFVAAPSTRDVHDRVPPVVAESTGADDVTDLLLRVKELELELAGSREHLQAVVEELESSNEELQSMNEELQASGEELQATNEELETTNEELQATNEELTTVNETLEVRTAELSESNIVLTNIQSSVHTAILLVDRDQRVLRFSPLAVKAFGLVASDIGTRLSRLPTNLDLDALPSILDTVMATREGEVREVSSTSATYLLQVMPYEEGGSVTGAVIALSDITELANARAELSVRDEEYRMIAETVPHTVYRASIDGDSLGYVSDTVSDVFGVTAEEVQADPGLLRSLVHPDDLAAVTRATAGGGGTDSPLDYRVVRPDGETRTVRELSHLVLDAHGLPRYRVGTILDITDLARARDVAERERRRAETTFSSGGTPMLTLTAAGVITRVNPLVHDLLRVDDEGVVGTPLTSWIEPAEVPETVRRLSEVAGGADPVTARTHYVARDGSLLTVDQTIAFVGLPEEGSDPGSATLLVSLRDVTAAEQATAMAAGHLAQLEAVFAGSSAAMSITSRDGHILRPNDALCELFGYPREELTGMHFAQLTLADDLPEETKLFGELLRGDRDRYSLVKRCITKSGEVIWGRLTVRSAPPLQPGAEPVLMATILDVTQERHREQAALRIAQTDPLTGLLNRTIVFDRLRQAIHRAHRSGEHISVLFIDLDDFKLVNDRLGHEAGDAVLTAVAERLRAATRESDSVARLGGDEYLVIAPHDLHEPPHEGGRLAQELLSVMSDPIRLTRASADPTAGADASGGVEVQAADEGTAVALRALESVSEGIDLGFAPALAVTASIGVAHYPSDGEGADELVNRADLAMYSAKGRGGDQVVFYSDRLQHTARLRAEQRADLSRALELGEIVPHYQPVVDARTGRPVELEALARWHHPERGVLPPSDFLALAEDFHRLDEMTLQLLRQAVADLPALRRRWPDLTVSVNLAPGQLTHPQFLDEVVRCLGPDLRGWTVEVTEAAAFSRDGVVLRSLERLREAGAAVALDDFGSGYSSLGQLRTFPFDELKLDRSFVCEPPESSHCALVQAMVTMSRALGAVTVAEGVETSAQARALTDLGVDRLQGFLFSPPLAQPDVLAWLNDERWGPDLPQDG